MANAQPLGTAWAWVEGDRWVYTRDREKAPPEALEVLGYNFEGMLVPHHSTGNAGRFIWTPCEWATTRQLANCGMRREDWQLAGEMRICSAHPTDVSPSK